MHKEGMTVACDKHPAQDGQPEMFPGRVASIQGQLHGRGTRVVTHKSHFVLSPTDQVAVLYLDVKMSRS